MILSMRTDGKSFSWTVVKLIMFYCLLSSARASMTFGDNFYIDLLLAILCFVYLTAHNMFSWNIQKVIASALLASAAMYTMHGSDRITAYLGILSSVLLPILLIGLRNNLKIELLNDFTKWMAVLLVLSLSAWLLHLAGLPLPHSTTVVNMYDTKYTLTIDNYYLFRESTSSNENLNEVIAWLPRFCGFFLEPGHMGTIVSFFLFVQCFNFKKWYNIVFLIVILFTLSAAAYTITIVGLFLYALANKSYKTVCATILIVASLILFALNYNGGDNILNELIIEKLTREDGAIAGRASSEVHSQFNRMIQNGNYLFGIGYQEFALSSGIFVFFVTNGVLGCLLVLVSYFSIYSTASSRIGFFLFLLFIISFLQRVYCFWDAFLDPYILGLPYLAQFSKRTVRK